MKACQNVIVTLTIGDEQLDVELPAFLPVAEVNARVLEMLRALYPQVYGSCTAIRLYDQGAPIAESRTLASCGIWDGASPCRAALCWSNLLFLTNCSASFCILQRI